MRVFRVAEVTLLISGDEFIFGFHDYLVLDNGGSNADEGIGSSHSQWHVTTATRGSSFVCVCVGSRDYYYYSTTRGSDVTISGAKQALG